MQHEAELTDGVESSDLRNVFTTLNALPNGFSKQCTVVTTNNEDQVTARTVVLVLALILLDEDQAAIFMLHAWYSSRLTPAMRFVLRDSIASELEKVVAGITTNDGSLVHKSWPLRETTVSVNLTKRQWIFTLKLVQTEWSVEEIESKRRSVSLDILREQQIEWSVDETEPERILRERRDGCEWLYYHQSPSMRLGLHKFRDSGVLLPFGHYDGDFTEANP